MPSQPLKPFAPPTGAVFNQLHASGISAGSTAEWILYIIFIFWALYTLIAIYHWFKYSHASWLAIPAIAAHLFISFVLMSYALSGAFSL